MTGREMAWLKDADIIRATFPWMETMKKKNPQDATLRNIRALKKRVKALEVDANTWRKSFKEWQKCFREWKKARRKAA